VLLNYLEVQKSAFQNEMDKIRKGLPTEEKKQTFVEEIIFQIF